MKYVYVVPSRRLGKSLGVNLTPFKTCTYSCVYCQLGRTTCKTVERKEFFKKEEILREIESALKTNPDYVTFAGEGEPTLYSKLKWLLDRIEEKTAVITNSSLLWRKDVREDLMNADVCLPSLDCATEKTFRKLNRPHRSLTLSKVVEGLLEFSDEYGGKIMLEIMLVKGYNDSREELEKMAEIVKEMKVDVVHVLTPIRPPASDVEKVDAEKLLEAMSFFKGCAIDFPEGKDFDFSTFSSLNEAVRIMSRHPMREDQVKEMAKHFNASVKDVEEIEGVFCKEFGGIKYYFYKK